jgi:hypothetical protein
MESEKPADALSRWWVMRRPAETKIKNIQSLIRKYPLQNMESKKVSGLEPVQYPASLTRRRQSLRRADFSSSFFLNFFILLRLCSDFFSKHVARSAKSPWGGSRLVINTCTPIRFMLGGKPRNFVRPKLRPPGYDQLSAKGN